ncbi:MAG: peptidyl-prolyl cis-trans isomerase SurA [Rhodospirillaceae bacterium]|nr:MAG: peptidyl-prolyl cis-trans isomerase SurA [Rhodospirillaceae bacterium]
MIRVHSRLRDWILQGALMVGMLGAPPGIAGAEEAPMAGAQAGAQERIAAIVNDEIISRHDVENRLDFVIGTSGLANTPDVRRRLLSQVLQTLVDERLKMQEAHSLQFMVSDLEIASAVAMIEQQNNLPRGGFERLIAERRLDRATAMNQLRAEVAWYKVTQRTVRPSAKVGENEIDASLQTLRAAAGQPRNLLAEIFLAVDDPAREDDVRTLAERLAEQLGAGADFKAIARQFSHNASAAAGGDLGWMAQGQLDPEIEATLATMQPGRLSPPIRTSSGYAIMLLRDRRSSRGAGETRFTLSQLFMPTTGPQALPPQTRSELIEAARTTSSCAAFEALAQKTKAPQSGALGQIEANDLPQQLRNVVLPLPLHTASAPVSVENGIAVLMVCERTDPPPPDLPSREEISRQIEANKITLMQHRKLRDLRRAAFIEVRL